MKPSTILYRARKLIPDEEHWVQGTLYDHSVPGLPRYCMVGAVGAAARDVIAQGRMPRQYLRRIIKELRPAMWNDAPGRTWEEVDAALLSAARLARSEGQ